MRVVRAFGRQRSETSRFIRNNHLMIRQEIFAWWASRVVEIAWAVLIPVATAAVIWAGGSRVLGPTEIPNMGIYAQVKDTEDNIIGLWQPLRPSG